MKKLRNTPPTSPWMACMICQRSSGIRLRLQSYLAWPFMTSRKCGRGQMSCNKIKYALRSLTKDLKFLRAVPPSKSPKVMRLVGIHNLDALRCFNGLTHCPWCGKESQSVWTIISHLRMVHYRLGLVCNKCYNFPSNSSDTLFCHGLQNCQSSGEEDPDKSAISE